MRAMRRARISSAATREAWSSCRHAVASGAAGGFGARSGGSRNASFNCMTALLWRRRLDVSAAQSVDDLAQVKQILESAQIVVAIADLVRWFRLIADCDAGAGRAPREIAEVRTRTRAPFNVYCTSARQYLVALLLLLIPSRSGCAARAL